MNKEQVAGCEEGPVKVSTVDSRLALRTQHHWAPSVVGESFFFF